MLRALYDWREARAAAADRPPFKIVGPDVLFAMADKVPKSVDEVARAIASYSRQADQVEILFAEIERALALPESELPAREAGERTSMSAAARKRVESLRTWRDAQAKASRIDPAVVMSQRVIERVAIAAPKTVAELAAVEGVRQWRAREWGAAVLAACA